MDDLATFLIDGAKGVDADPVRSVELFGRAIDGGSVTSLNKLAVVLEKDAKRVDADPVRAAELYRRAIDGGEVIAMVNLARLLSKGARGVNPDRARAIALYSRVIEHGGDSHSQGRDGRTSLDPTIQTPAETMRRKIRASLAATPLPISQYFQYQRPRLACGLRESFKSSLHPRRRRSNRRTPPAAAQPPHHLSALASSLRSPVRKTHAPSRNPTKNPSTRRNTVAAVRATAASGRRLEL